MIKDVLKMGDPRLLEKSLPVDAAEFNTQELNSLIEDMVDTMRAKGGVGITAVQIGVHKRIALIEYKFDNPRYENLDPCPLTIVINPEFEAVTDEMVDYNEGCLSVPNIRGVVSRPKALEYKFYNQLGELITGTDDTFFVRVLQHETDHMDGILFPMRADLKTLSIIKEE